MSGEKTTKEEGREGERPLALSDRLRDAWKGETRKGRELRHGVIQDLLEEQDGWRQAAEQMLFRAQKELREELDILERAAFKPGFRLRQLAADIRQFLGVQEGSSLCGFCGEPTMDGGCGSVLCQERQARARDESPLDDLERALATAEVKIGPGGSVAELAPIIDATPWPELTGDEDASAFVERLEREQKPTDPEVDVGAVGELFGRLYGDLVRKAPR